jgi:hypothetical protein
MKNLIVFFTLLFVTASRAQSVTGYWYGQANVEVSGIQNNYLTELIIAQKGNKVKGFFGYYFKDVYQSFVVKGTYDPSTRRVVIRDIPIIFYRTNSTMNSVDCITSFVGTLRVSKVKTELSGYFYRDKKYTYTCPDLRVNYTLYAEAKVEDSIFKDMTSTRSFWKPQPPPVELVRGNEAKTETEMLAAADSEATVNNHSTAAADTKSNSSAGRISETKDPAANVSNSASSSASTKQANEPSPNKSNNPKARPPGSAAGTTGNPDRSTAGSGVLKTGDQEIVKSGTSAGQPGQETGATPVLAEEKPVIPPDILKISKDYKKRKQILGKLISVASDSVRLSFYDNAEVDGDSISVFLNGDLVVAHQGLSERAFNVYVKLDSTKEINEISMFAENLGKYPPNTALMVISDGEQRYETYLSSDFSGNATIRLRHRKNGIAGTPAQQ